MLTLAELLRVPHVDGELGFDISPDGTRIMFSWNKSGCWELHELEFGSDSARLVSQAPGAAFSPKYSPDGRSSLMQWTWMAASRISSLFRISKAAQSLT